MSSDLRVALRIQANSGNSRREIQNIERDLRQAGKNGAKALADEANKAGTALNKSAQAGAASYRIVRQVMRDAAVQGSGVFRQDVTKTQAELKQLGQIGRQAARETKSELAKADREGVQPLTRSVDKAETAMRRLGQNGVRNLRMLKTVAASVRGEYDRLKNFGNSTMGKLAGFGVGVGAAASLKNSAQLDRQLVRTQQTAGMSGAERDAWRQEGYRIGKAYGVDPGAIYSGGDALLAGGLSVKATFASADAIGQGTAVTGADSSILAGALMTGSKSFDIDLENQGAALDMLQKMTVAGRLGAAELENLSDIFPKIGSNAKAAGMSLAQSLAFVETLSAFERQPERLGTLAESTLRVFNNPQYRDQITKASGVQFFNKDHSARDPQAVLADLKRKYDAMGNDEDRAKFMGTVFKSMDQDTLRGMRFLLPGDSLSTMASHTQKIENAGPVFQGDLKANTQSATGTAGRLRATLGDAIDRMAQPLNKGFADMGSYLLDDLNLSGEQLLAGGVAAGVGGYYAGRGAKAGAGALLNRFIGGPETLKNLAVGKVLEEAAGVTSVFVTNWPTGMGSVAAPDFSLPNGKGRVPGPPGGPKVFSAMRTVLGLLAGSELAALPAFGTGAMLMAGTAVAGAGAAGYGLGTLANKGIDKGISSLTGRPNTLGTWMYEKTHTDPEIDGPALSHGARENARNWAADLNARLQAGLPGRTATGPDLLGFQNSEQFRRDVNAVTGPQTWVAGVAGRLVDSAMAPPAGGTNAAESRLAELLSKPLIVEVRTDSHMITAEVERRADVQMRRGQ